MKPGQDVKLKYDAFPYQKFGVANGSVVSVSATALRPVEVGINSESGELLYRISVSLKKQTISAFSNEVPLQVGMELSADIVLENRSLLEWLIEPFQRQ